MRIALVHYTAPPVAGGVERVVGHQSVLLADAGHDVRLVAGRGASPDARVDLRSVPLVDSRDPDVAIVQEELDAGRVTGAFAGLRDRAVIELRAVLADVDVALCHNVCSLNKNLPLTAALRRLADESPPARFVIWHHDLAWVMDGYRFELHQGAPWDLLREAWPGTIQVVVSETRRRQLAALTGLDADRIRVVPNGVDLARLLKLEPATLAMARRLRLTDVQPLLLMPARIVRRKNIELGLATVAALRRMARPAGLVVTGPADPHDLDASSYLRQLTELRDRLGLAGAVWFLHADSGEVLPDAVVADLHALADLLFLPSREEGFGIPIIEALVNRLPIVCADIPTLREVAGDAALYIDPDADPENVARRIVEYLDGDPRLCRSMAARRFYAWESVYRRWLVPLLDEIGSPGAVDLVGTGGRLKKRLESTTAEDTRQP